MITFLKMVFYTPLYNGLIALVDVVPWADVGITIVVFTVLVKFILFPLSKKAVRTQLLMKKIQPELDELKKKYKNDRQKQAKEMMALYAKEKVNPFSSILVVLIQLPIIFSLYYVFFKGGLPNIDIDLLYNFVPIPENINIMFLGFIDITQRSVILAITAGLSAFFQIRYSIPPYKRKGEIGKSLKDDLARSMNVQMRYVFPVVVLFIAYGISAAVALYWTTSNLFTLGQELYLRRVIFKDQNTKNEPENPTNN